MDTKAAVREMYPHGRYVPLSVRETAAYQAQLSTDAERDRAARIVRGQMARGVPYATAAWRARDAIKRTRTVNAS